MADEVFTYDISTPIGKVRFEIGDTDISKVSGQNREVWSAIFTDGEIQYAIDDSGQSIKYAAYRLVMAIANNRTMISRRQRANGATDRDLSYTTKEIREQAKRLYEEAMMEGQVEEITTVTWNDFTFRDRLGFR